MKNLILTSIFVFLICTCQSQVKSNTPSVQSKNDYSKYVGRYHLKNADSLILYDYFDIKEKNGNLYCIRESKVKSIESTANIVNNVITLKPTNNKTKSVINHFDCEVPYVNISEEKISFKFNEKIYSYKFRISPYLKRYEIVIIDDALVYEKR